MQIIKSIIRSSLGKYDQINFLKANIFHVQRLETLNAFLSMIRKRSKPILLDEKTLAHHKNIILFSFTGLELNCTVKDFLRPWLVFLINFSVFEVLKWSVHKIKHFIIKWIRSTCCPDLNWLRILWIFYGQGHSSSANHRP